MEALISICITTYNLDAYISQTIESILMQETDIPFEIIIGDDASIDKTREILLAYKEKYPEKIRLVLHDKNIGVAKNDIAVVQAAKGKYLAWCDGDDYWITKDKLQKQYDILEQNPDVSLVHTDWLNLYEEENRTEEHRIKVKNIEKVVYGREAIELFITSGTTGCRFSSCMFRKSYYLDALENFPDLFLCGHVCNDFAVFVAMCERGRLYHLPDVTVAYRIRKESLSFSQSENKRLRYALGYLRLISVILIRYNFSTAVSVAALQNILSGLLTYTYKNKKKKEAFEIKQLIVNTKYRFTIGQRLVYLGSISYFANLLIRPIVFLGKGERIIRKIINLFFSPKENVKIKVLLVGIGSLRNYGCEGIVQGTYNMLREFWPECELIVATENPVADSITFEGCENITFKFERKRFTPYRIWKGILRRFLKIGEGSYAHLNSNLVKKANVFLSCGGDNFCEAPDGSMYGLLKDLIKTGENAKKNDLFYALWGVSVGPFSIKNQKKIYYHLKKFSNLIFVREKLAQEYLLNIGIEENKIKFIADPAFYMQSDMNYTLNRQENEILIGLNVSLLAFSPDVFPVLDELFSINNQIKIICIPHVMSSDGGPQDDYTFLQQYIQYSRFKNRIQLLPSDLGAKKTKGCIAQCDMIVAARMHACVAGVSTGIPTLFLTYSNKGIGMAQYVYNHQDWVISNKELNARNLIEKTEKMLKEKDSIHQYLLENNSRFRSDASKGIVVLKEAYLNANKKVYNI